MKKGKYCGLNGATKKRGKYASNLNADRVIILCSYVMSDRIKPSKQWRLGAVVSSPLVLIINRNELPKNGLILFWQIFCGVNDCIII